MLECFDNQDFDSDVIHSGTKFLSLMSKIFTQDLVAFLSPKIPQFTQILTQAEDPEV